MTRPRSLRARLLVVFGGVALAVMGVIYVAVVPGLQSSLVRDKLDDLRAAAQVYSERIEAAVGTERDARVLDRLVRQAADEASARVTLFGVTRGSEGVQTYIASDSSLEVEIRNLRFMIAERTARTGKVSVSSEDTPAGRIGEAALPVFYGPPGRRQVSSVLVFSAPLRDAERSVAVVRRRVLAATGLALVLALAAAALVARQVSRAARRFEDASRRVAAGDFSVQFPVDRDDEIGQIGRSLEDMRRQLAELESARKRFIATASHELRTPIFSLGGYLELLQDEELDPETRDRFLTQVRAQVDRLGRLATDLLDLSRLEAGSVELRAEPVDVRDVARQVAGEFEPALTAHDSHLTLELPAGAVRAVCDPERVGQVVRILLDNALNHTPPGTAVTVAAAGGDGRVRIEVTDLGPGISAAMLPHIFDPFFTSDDAQGAGLGLAIAHELAERMDGRLAVASEPGRTAFTLEIPA